MPRLSHAICGVTVPASVIVALTVGAAARPASHGIHRHHASRMVYEQPYATSGGWQAAAIAHATTVMQNAPGVTNELAPDAKETATGGPVGGVPGFSGM